MSKIGGYASLSYSADTQSDEATSLMTRMSKLGSEISYKILFFDLWWKTQVDDKNAKRLIKDSGELAECLSHKTLFAKYALSEPEEKIINTLDVTGISALVKLYDKMTSAYEYRMKVGGKTKKMTREEITNYIRSTNPKIRETAYKTILTKYTENKGVIGEIYQNVVLNWKDEGIEIRGYESPISMRNNTRRTYLACVRRFALYFHRSPEELGDPEIREYLHYLIKERSVSQGAVTQAYGALKFFYETTLKRD